MNKQQKTERIDKIASLLGYDTNRDSAGLLATLLSAQPVESNPAPPHYIVGVDFDGTCVTHEFPRIGKTVPYCIEVLKKLVANHAGLILFTMRSGDYLADAVAWFERYGIPLYGVNTNPTQGNWTTSPKAYCHLYVDDAALGCPLKYEPSFSKRPYVDWKEVDYWLKHHDYYVPPIINP